MGIFGRQCLARHRVENISRCRVSDIKLTKCHLSPLNMGLSSDQIPRNEEFGVRTATNIDVTSRISLTIVAPPALVFHGNTRLWGWWPGVVEQGTGNVEPGCRIELYAPGKIMIKDL